MKGVELVLYLVGNSNMNLGYGNP